MTNQRFWISLSCTLACIMLQQAYLWPRFNCRGWGWIWPSVATPLSTSCKCTSLRTRSSVTPNLFAIGIRISSNKHRVINPTCNKNIPWKLGNLWSLYKGDIKQAFFPKDENLFYINLYFGKKWNKYCALYWVIWERA